MRINDIFHIKRFYLLIKRDFYTQYKTYLLGLGAMFCILFIINISTISSYYAWNFNLVFYPLTLFIGGSIFTSLSFHELSPEQNRVSYLMLPASSVEKMLSKLVMTSIGYVLGSLILYFLFSLIAFFFSTLLFGFAHRIFNPFQPVIWLCIRVYLVTQSLFLFGAVFFRKNAFLKTILCLFGLALVYAIFILGILTLTYLFSSLNGNIYFSFELFRDASPNGFHHPTVVLIIMGIFSNIVQILFWFFLAPLLWVITFFRIKEIEV